MSEPAANPLLAFAGFVALVALVLTIVISSIALYRRIRQRQQCRLSSTTAIVRTGRKRARQDTAIGTDNRQATPACRDVIRLTAIEDVRKASSYNTVREPLKSDAVVI